ncbi:MAG: radical SAM family heme chaperone HemW [bacterium]|nr:radical SAM family heme chaperone HemW [bacterium]
MIAFENPLAVYLHVPFCRVKCTYCAFNTYVDLDALIEPFVQALIREIHLVGTSKPGQRVGTIFFGGGTPTLLTPDQFARILDALHQAFVVLPGAEISLEANPSDITRPYLTALRQAGLNRISIGMQSAVESELRLFNRRHDNDTVVRAVSAARLAGFDNLNLDVIYAVPHQTLENWDATLTQMLALKPDHVSLYALTLEDNTHMKLWVEKGRLPQPDDDLAADMYDLATDKLGAAGFEQYEISNWSLPGKQCQHNLQYWRSLPYLGLGPGAHGFADRVRYSVILSPQRYIKLLENPDGGYEYPRTPVTAEANLLTLADEMAETLIMGLRLTQEGIQRETFRQRFGVDLIDVHGDIIRKYAAHHLMGFDDQRVWITTQGRLLSSMIFREFV